MLCKHIRASEWMQSPVEIEALSFTEDRILFRNNPIHGRFGNRWWQ